MLPLHRLERKQKKYSNPFLIRIFLFLSLLIWNWNNKYVHTICSSLKNHTRYPDQNGQSVSDPFWTKTAEKPYPMGQDIPIWLMKGSTPPPPPGISHSCEQSRLLSYWWEGEKEPLPESRQVFENAEARSSRLASQSCPLSASWLSVCKHPL